MSTRARVLVVDDHPVVREGLRELLSREPGLSVIGDEASVDGALRACRELRPDVVLVDLSLGADSGLRLVAAIRDAFADTAVLVLSMHDEKVFALRSLEAGARGYVGKHESSERIVAAVHRVLAGRTVVSEAVSDVLLSAFSRRAGSRPRRAGVQQLSSREVEILHLIGRGAATTAIAARLGISPKTVDAHRARIKKKLGVRSATELVVVAGDWLRGNEGRAGSGGPGVPPEG